MMDNLLARGRAIATQRAKEATQEIAALVKAELPGLAVSVVQQGVAIGGKALIGLLLRDSRLRGIGALIGALRK